MSTAAAIAAQAATVAPTAGTAMSAPAASAKTTYVCQMESHHHTADQSPAKEYDKPGICPTDGMEMIAKKSRLRVAVLVFNGVQDIDYAGPMEVFGQSGANIFTVAATTDSVRSTFGIRMQPDFDIDHAPEADIVLVPGGNVSSVTKDPKMLDWLRQRSGDTRAVLSVCTGAFILGKAGLLDGLSATTIAGATAQLAKNFPKAHVVTDRRYVDNGRIVTTGGLSAGIDGALHMVDRELGRLRAQDIARGMEYQWQPDGNSSFGQLAGNEIPDLATLLPAGITWERLVDEGDMHHWETSGRLELTTGPQEFLDASVKKITAASWTQRADSNKLRRSFVMTKEGKTWHMSVALAPEAQAPNYQLRFDIEEVKGPTKDAGKA